MKKKVTAKWKWIMSVSIVTQLSAKAQFLPAYPQPQPTGTPLWSIGAQIRPRAEFRQGLGNPMPIVNAPSSFVSQRTNLNMGFKWDLLNVNIDLRDVRVWGQDASSISNADGARFFLHQAWGEFTLASNADTNCILPVDNLSVKVGRQEIGYDDVRLLGNLDWLQQGRRHDAAIVKLNHKGYQADLGVAYNQNTDAFGFNGNQYTSVNGYANGSVVYTQGTNPWIGTPPSTNALVTNYKMFQYLYGTKKIGRTKISVLAFKDDFQKFNLTSVTNTATGVTTLTRTYTKHNDIKSRYTVGGQFSTERGNATEGIKMALSAGYYHQLGSDPRRHENSTAPDKLNANHAFAYLTLQKGKFSFGPGFDYLSGNNTEISENANGTLNTRSLGSQNNRFDPLYGTPHRWWGYMDYFYVGTGSPTAGLMNYYVKGKYNGGKWWVGADYHLFTTAFKTVKYRKAGETEFTDLGSTYGQELDIILNYDANKFTNIELGYGAFVSTDALAASKNFKVGSVKEWNHWAYLQINIKPNFLFQKPVPLAN